MKFNLGVMVFLFGVSLHAFEHPSFIEKKSDPLNYVVGDQRVVTKSICGIRNGMQNVNSYRPKRGITMAYVRELKSPVGALALDAHPRSSKFCSGTLISHNLFLTASHCVDSGIDSRYVVFNFERTAAGRGLLRQRAYRVLKVLEDGHKLGLDYAILELDGRPGSRFGWSDLNFEAPEGGSTIAIIQHPQGKPKMVDVGTITRVRRETIGYGSLDTQPGSSGSGILNSEGELLGVHTLGGCSILQGHNSGYRLDRIAELSPLLQAFESDSTL